MPNAKAPQTEGIAFAKGNRIYVSSEGRKPIFKQTLYVFSTGHWLNANITNKRLR